MGKVVYNIDTTLVEDKTVGEIASIAMKINKAGSSEEAGLEKNFGISVLFADKELRRYKFYGKGYSMTYLKVHNLLRLVGDEFIKIHRLNHFAYSVMQQLCDALEEKKRLTPKAVGYLRKIRKINDDYQSAWYRNTEMSSYRTAQDHVRLAYSYVAPQLEPLKCSIRDYFIRKRSEMVEAGQKDDITLLTEIQTVILFCVGLKNSRRNFFSEFVTNYGIDCSSGFAYADIDAIYRNFVWMMEQSGVRFVKDKDGDFALLGIDIEASVRVNSEWNKIVNVVCDNKLMDETALAAINMNPETKANYEAYVAQVDKLKKAEEEAVKQQELDAALEKLKEMPKVKRL